MTSYDALLVIGFGGPECRDDVIPFLENVVSGRAVPRERLLEVAEHYYHFDGVSPINQQARDLIAALREELDRHGIDLPIFWGNRNWNPMLTDTIREMKDQHIEHSIGLVLSAYSSYSGCRQYREDVMRAQSVVGAGSPSVDKLRSFYNHPLFIDANYDRVQQAIEQLPAAARADFRILFTAHSIPLSMADSSQYVQQLTETSRLVAEKAGLSADRWSLVYQSRSGRPDDPWLEPDILDALQTDARLGKKHVIIMPIGFLSDHMEVLFDLDEEARLRADELGMTMVRAGTVGTHPQFVSMLRELIEERLDPQRPKRSIGHFGPSHDTCPVDCCPAPRRRPMASDESNVT
ncbi:MAG: ferrochelatase [Planctomycetota bacterium]|nr:ferrochelatase [Planctomycetota bacterium]MDA1212926.1 ferrochelatase [Planctomycetota bacterium]